MSQSLYLVKRPEDGFDIESLEDLRDREDLHYEYILGIPENAFKYTENLEDLDDLSKAIDERYNELLRVVLKTYESGLFPSIRSYFEGHLGEYGVTRSNGSYKIDPGRRDIITFALAYILYENRWDKPFIKLQREGEVSLRGENLKEKNKMYELQKKGLIIWDNWKWKPIKYNSFESVHRLLKNLINEHKKKLIRKNKDSHLLNEAIKALGKYEEERERKEKEGRKKKKRRTTK